MSSDKQFHPGLRKLIILLKLSIAATCDKEQLVSSFTTASAQKLALTTGGHRRRRGASQLW